MKRNLFVLLVLLTSSALYAQENVPLSNTDARASLKQYNPGAQDTRVFTGKDLLNMFNEYNPSVLQKAADNEHYKNILDKLTTTYSAPQTDQNELEMIALAINFDNSIRLEALRRSYLESRALQTAMGTDLASLERATQENLQPIVQDIFKNTLAVKKIQIKRYQKQIKTVKADKTLSAAEKQTQISWFKSRIAQVKKEISSLKKNAKQSVQDAANVYLIDMRSEYEAAMHETAQAEQSDTHDVKANHKKPVAQ